MLESADGAEPTRLSEAHFALGGAYSSELNTRLSLTGDSPKWSGNDDSSARVEVLRLAEAQYEESEIVVVGVRTAICDPMLNPELASRAQAMDQPTA